MKKAEIDQLESLIGKINAFYTEIVALSKKTPNDAVNKFKLKFINKTLEETNTLLTDKHRPFNDFSVFEEDDLPSNSDVVFILSQYAEAVDLYRSKHVAMKAGNWCYVVDDDKDAQIRSAPPATIRKKD